MARLPVPNEKALDVDVSMLFIMGPLLYVYGHILYHKVEIDYHSGGLVYMRGLGTYCALKMVQHRYLEPRWVPYFYSG